MSASCKGSMSRDDVVVEYRAGGADAGVTVIAAVDAHYTQWCRRCERPPVVVVVVVVVFIAVTVCHCPRRRLPHAGGIVCVTDVGHGSCSHGGMMELRGVSKVRMVQARCDAMGSGTLSCASSSRACVLVRSSTCVRVCCV